MTSQLRSGFIFAVSAYAVWGFFPFYFLAIAQTGPWEIAALRVVLTLAVCIFLLSVGRRWKAFVPYLRQPRVFGLFALAGVLVYINWLVYVIAVVTDHVVEASLGYFINPIVTVFLGVLFLKEKLRPLQWSAIAVALIAVVVLSVGYGQVPLFALTLALSFGFYGLIKKQGGAVDALSSLTLETTAVAPLAIVQLSVFAATGALTFGTFGAGQTALLSLAGVVTAVPLLLFAAAARRIPLVYLGLIQFMTPIMQFLIGVFITREPMPLERWIGFGIVWIACLMLIVDSVRHTRRSRVDFVGDEADPLGSAVNNEIRRKKV